MSRADLRLLVSEVRLLLGRRRTWALLGVLVAVTVLLGVAVEVSGDDGGGGDGGGPPLLGRITDNGLFLAVTALGATVPFFLPLAVGVVAGDSVAGEAQLGTLRYLLAVPVGRTRLLLVKYATAVVFCLCATGTVALTGVLTGLALFPVGEVALLSGDVVSAGGAAWRVVLVAAYVTLSLLGLCAVGLFVSTLTEVPVGAMAGTVVVAIAAQLLGSIPQLDWLHPWLLTRYWLGFADLLREPVSWGTTVDNAVLQAGWVAVFGSLAWARFTTRDVTS